MYNGIVAAAITLIRQKPSSTRLSYKGYGNILGIDVVKPKRQPTSIEFFDLSTMCWNKILSYHQDLKAILTVRKEDNSSVTPDIDFIPGSGYFFHSLLLLVPRMPPIFCSISASWVITGIISFYGRDDWRSLPPYVPHNTLWDPRAPGRTHLSGGRGGSPIS